MGVPAFYRWISEKYPKIVVDVLEQRPMVVEGVVIPVDLTQPNPNSVEYDNLFVDMNGLIHPCSHPEDREAPRTEEEMYVNVTKYVDRLVAAIRPRRLLFLAIDGVAPRAKMNQQRSRRFRSAQEAQERKEAEAEVMGEMLEMGYVAPDRDEDAAWDSNVITPGTEFMTKISVFLRFYVLERMNRDPLWKNLKVIVSDASEPGEGEHKIMDYIRSQRTQPGYNPNLHHVLHGLDADLIMLALATHEAHFTILREKVFFGKKDKEGDSISDEQKLLNAQAMRNGIMMSSMHPEDEWLYKKPLQALRIHVLREYLEAEFNCLRDSIPFPYELERVIDDFIFLCFFVGNDFLPHLPSLDIRDGALDFLMECYKDMLPSLGSYITNPGGFINLPQADVILSKVGEIEDQIFLRKKAAEDQFESRMESRKAHNQSRQQQQQQMKQQQQQREQQQQLEQLRQNMLANSTTELDQNSKNSEAAAALRGKLGGKRPNPDTAEEEESNKKAKTADGDDADKDNKGVATKDDMKVKLKEKEQSKIDRYKKEIQDPVKLHERGWKDRYYNEQFKKDDVQNGGGLKQMCISYVQGLCWVLRYYYQGVPSWNWYYPFHYAPFASDLVNIDTYGDMKFVKSEPFRPLEQLLAVLPASSAPALPEECRWLMLDKKSPIIDLYDENIPIDPNGKHLPWLWILLLPFIDESRINTAFTACKQQLSLESRMKNKFGPSVIFVHESNPLVKLAAAKGLNVPAQEGDPEVVQYYKTLAESSVGHDDTDVVAPSADSQDYMALDSYVGNSTSGTLGKAPMKWFCPMGSRVPPPPGSFRWFTDIPVNRVACFEYQLPETSGHESKMLPGVVFAPSVLHPSELQQSRMPKLNRSGFNIMDLFQRSRNPQSQFDRSFGYIKHDERHGHLHGGGYNGNNLMPNPSNHRGSVNPFQSLPNYNNNHSNNHGRDRQDNYQQNSRSNNYQHNNNNNNNYSHNNSSRYQDNNQSRGNNNQYNNNNNRQPPPPPHQRGNGYQGGSNYAPGMGNQAVGHRVEPVSYSHQRQPYNFLKSSSSTGAQKPNNSATQAAPRTGFTYPIQNRGPPGAAFSSSAPVNPPPANAATMQSMREQLLQTLHARDQVNQPQGRP